MKYLTTTLYPNAKINLALNIIYKRADGFHELKSIFAPIQLTDKIFLYCSKEQTLSLQEENCFSLKIEPKKIESLGKVEDNIIYKAYRLFCDTFQIFPKSVEVELEKHIPIGAGMGGGSSDAASTLLGLREIYKPDLSIKELHSVAMELGSDVAFFLYNQVAIASGRGELLSPVSIYSPYYILLVNPGIHISTAGAYGKFKKPTMEEYKKNKRNNFLLDYEDHILKNVIDWKGVFTNDFEDIIFPDYPIIEKIKNELYYSGAAFSLMSGSGSTVFGIFKEEEELLIAKARIEKGGTDFFIYQTKFL